MSKQITILSELRHFLLLWLTQLISGLGSAMTSYALVIWSYTQEGSALMTALLMVCSYAPYVLCSIFAGAISDRWDKKKIMLWCDLFAAIGTLSVLILLKTDRLELWHLYLINAFSGLMNTVQQPASEVAATALLPKKYYQKAGGLTYLSSSVQSILTPILATAILGLGGIDWLFAIDLFSFVFAAGILLLWIPIPKIQQKDNSGETFSQTIRTGISYLRQETGILHLMLFLAAINLVASMYNAAFPARMLSLPNRGELSMGIVNTVAGLTTLLGSLVATAMKPPKRPILTIWLCLFLSMSTENFFLAFGSTIPLWSIGTFLGWIAIPWMNANLNATLRSHIPPEIQGRVYAARNSLQFFTIPVGYLLGGWLVDQIFEPLLTAQADTTLLARLFGNLPGSGSACFFAAIGVLGVLVCLVFRFDKSIWRLEK